MLKIIKMGFICSFLCNYCLVSAFQLEARAINAMYSVCLCVFFVCPFVPFSYDFQNYLTKRVGILVDADYLKILLSLTAAESNQV